MRLVIGIATVSSLVAAAPSVAKACSAYACGHGVLSPFEDGTVPKNLPGIFWRPMGSFDGIEAADPSKVVLATTADPATPLPFTATLGAGGTYMLVPMQPLVAGTHYTVTDTNSCDYNSQAGPRSEFTATADAPLPTTLGTIETTSDGIDTFLIATVSGSCSSSVVAHRLGFAPNLSDEARPWSHVFHFQTYVDGQPWTRTESAPLPASLQGTWYVYRTCETNDDGTSPSLPVGPHEIKVKATIPGTTVELWSDPLAIELYCPGEKDENGDNVPDVVEDDSGCNAGGGASPWLLLLALGYTARRKRQR